MKSVTNDIVEGLFDLVTVYRNRSKGSVEFKFDQDVSILQFGIEKGDRFLDDHVDVFHSRGERLRPNGTQKLRDDMIKAGDLLPRYVNRFTKL